MTVYKSKESTKDGRKWYFSICYTATNGEKKRKKSEKHFTKPEAQEAERQFLIEKAQNRIDITFEEMYYQYLDYIEESIKGSTIFTKNNRMKNHVLNYFGKMNIHDINVNTVIEWKTKINKSSYSNNKKYSLRYKQNIMIELRTILNYGMKFYGLKENVACVVNNFQDKSEEVITDEEKVRYIKPHEYNLFISVIKNIVFKVFFAFLYYMGVRKGEAQALNWTDILWDIDKVRINKTITKNTYELDDNGFHFKITNTKNRKNRTITMPPIIKKFMLELYEYYKIFEGFNENWFVFGGYKHLPSVSIDREKEHYFDLVKKFYGVDITRITNHEFRHSHASYLISEGVSDVIIAKRLGDTVEVIRKVYTHLFPEVEDDVINKLNLVEDNYKLNINIINLEIKKEFL